MMYIFVAILAGITIVISRVINFSLSERIGILQSTFYNYVVGLIFSMLILFFSKEVFVLSKLNDVQGLFPYLGGAVGIIVVMLSIYLSPRISAFYLTLFIFVGQLFMGIVIDYMTLNTLSLGKIVGGLLVFVGLGYNLIIDKKLEGN